MTEFEQDDRYYQAQEAATTSLDKIVADAPDIPGYGGGKWAMYSVGCCWWTSDPAHLGNTRDFPRPKLKPEYEKHLGDHGLPCCPHCGSVLMQAPLEQFVAAAKSNPNHYGEWGLWAFVAAHHTVASRCYKRWNAYEPPLWSDYHQSIVPPMYA